MVTIVNPKPDPNVVKQCVCRNCGVTLEYTPNDTYQDKVYDYRGDVDTYNRIDCPNCRHKITV